jgi:DNA-binding SARP family transcriptional activator
VTKTQTAKARDRRLEMNFLGVPEVRLGARVLHFRSRKILALLAYLILEPGLHSRDKLADLLWPEADESAGRASLRNALAQINSELGVLRSNREAVSWNSSNLDLDVLRLERAFRFIGNPASAELEAQLEAVVGACRGGLLEGLDFSDAPDFDDWLLTRREIARAWLDAVLERLSELQAQSGRVAAALETAQRRVRLEPLSEAAYRSVIALQLQSGNRSAALETYQTCKKVLETELGLEPSVETQVLLERLHQPTSVVVPVSTPLEHQTRFVGRLEVCARMEAAWQSGKHIFIAGEAGTGKSRLLFEFAATKGAYAQQFGRPGDQVVPFSSITRGIRHALEAHLNLELPAWAGRELSRLIPELSDEPLPPLSSNEDRLRLFAAVNRFFDALRDRGLYPLGDDFQFVDDSSLELIAYLMTNGPTSFPVSLLAAFRPEEISSRFNEILGQMVEAGHAILIELEPLGALNIAEMLEDLIPDNVQGQALANALHRFTGGNSLFVLETIRALREQGGLETLTAERFENRRRVAGLPRTAKVQTIIQRRLERLSTPARDLAQVAAVAGEHFTLELGAKVLETPVLELSRAAVELEAVHVWHGLRFSHDLLFETTLEHIPESLKPLLHGRVLDGLEGSSVPAAVLAGHAFASERWQEAFKYSLDAAESGVVVFALHEALEHSEQARKLLREPPKGFALPDVNDVQRLYRSLLVAHLRLHHLDLGLEEAQEMLLLAQNANHPSLECQALLHLHSFVSYEGGGRIPNYERQLSILNQALQIAEAHDLEDWGSVQSNLMELEYNRTNFEAMLERFAQVSSQTHRLSEQQFGRVLYWKALAELGLGQWTQADLDLQKPLSLADSFDRHHLAKYQILSVSALCKLCLGHVQDGAALARLAYEMALELTPRNPPYPATPTIFIRGLITTGFLAEALDTAERIHALVNQPNVDLSWRIQPCFILSWTLWLVGQSERALQVVHNGFEFNAILETHWPWASTYTDMLNSLACGIQSQKGDWQRACHHAKLAASGRFRSDAELGEDAPNLPRHLEIEALLYGDEVELARESVRRLGAFAGHYVRRQIPYLRALSVLEVWEGNLQSAIQHLLEARALMIPMGLPNERWTLEAKLAELYEQNGDLEKSREAREIALTVIDSLVEKITDEAMRETFLIYAHLSLTVKNAQHPV